MPPPVTQRTQTLTVQIIPGGEVGYTAKAVALQPVGPTITTSRDSVDPFRAAANALAEAMIELGYDGNQR